MVRKSGNAWAQRLELEQEQQQSDRSFTSGSDAEPSMLSYSDLAVFPAEGPAVSKNFTPSSGGFTSPPLPAGLSETKNRTEPQIHGQRISAMPKPLFSGKPVASKNPTSKPGHPIPDVEHVEVADTRNLLVGGESNDKKSETLSKVEQLKSKFNIKDSANTDNKNAATDATTPASAGRVRRVLDAFYYPKEKGSGPAPNSAGLPPKGKLFQGSPNPSRPDSPTPRMVFSAPGMTTKQFFLENKDKDNRKNNKNNNINGNENTNKEKPSSLSSTGSVETSIVSYVTPKERSQSVTMSGPSWSPTRQGTYAKSGTPELLLGQRDISSMDVSVQSAGSRDSEAWPFPICSPSVCGVPADGAWDQAPKGYLDLMPPSCAESPPHTHRLSLYLQHQGTTSSPSPFIVSSEGFHHGSPSDSQARVTGTSFTSVAVLPPNLLHPNDPMHQRVNFAEMPSQEGYPNPPHAMYQEQDGFPWSDYYFQSTIHHHIEAGANKTNNQIIQSRDYVLDQIVSRLDAISADLVQLKAGQREQSNVLGQIKSGLTVMAGDLQLDSERLTRELRNIRAAACEGVTGTIQGIKNVDINYRQARGEPHTPKHFESPGNSVPTPTAAFRTPPNARFVAGTIFTGSPKQNNRTHTNAEMKTPTAAPGVLAGTDAGRNTTPVKAGTSQTPRKRGFWYPTKTRPGHGSSRPDGDKPRLLRLSGGSNTSSKSDIHGDSPPVLGPSISATTPTHAAFDDESAIHPAYRNSAAAANREPEIQTGQGNDKPRQGTRHSQHQRRGSMRGNHSRSRSFNSTVSH